MNILRDKINYGVFLDHFTANILLDHFIEHQNYKDAAEIACDMMLQEDLSHPLCQALSWLACHRRVIELLLAVNVTDDSANSQAADDEEIMYRRVAFIENPWYDDHFDIPTERQKIGKTLTVLTSSPGGDILSRCHLLLGWALYEKLDKVLALMHQWLVDQTLPSAAVSLAQLDQVRSVIESISTREPPAPKELGLLTLSDLYPYVTEQQKLQCLTQFAELVGKLRSAGKVATDESVDSTDAKLLKRVTDSLSVVSQTDIDQISTTYRGWINSRQSALDQQLEQYKLTQKKKQIALRLVELRQREEKLRYFEEQSKIELNIAELPSDWDRPVTGDVSEEQFVAPPGERKGEAGKRAR
jgi:small subunit ribosomal protein S27